MRTKAQVKKDQIISGLVETRRKILDTASSLSPAEQDEIFLGVWSVKDLLAHLVGWDFTNMEAAKEILAGKLPHFYSYYDRDWKTYNARLVAEYKRDDFADLLSLVKDSHQKLIDFLKTIPAEEFDKDRGIRFKGYEVTIASILQVEIDDERTHHTQVKEFWDQKQPITR
ncbi:MAG: DinB family protein [Anaerolineae bacterium]